LSAGTLNWVEKRERLTGSARRGMKKGDDVTKRLGSPEKDSREKKNCSKDFTHVSRLEKRGEKLGEQTMYSKE